MLLLLPGHADINGKYTGHPARILTLTCLAAGSGCCVGRKKVRWRGQRTDVGSKMYRETSSWLLGTEDGSWVHRAGNESNEGMECQVPQGERGHFFSI